MPPTVKLIDVQARPPETDSPIADSHFLRRRLEPVFRWIQKGNEALGYKVPEIKAPIAPYNIVDAVDAIEFCSKAPPPKIDSINPWDANGQATAIAMQQNALRTAWYKNCDCVNEELGRDMPQHGCNCIRYRVFGSGAVFIAHRAATVEFSFDFNAPGSLTPFLRRTNEYSIGLAFHSSCQNQIYTPFQSSSGSEYGQVVQMVALNINYQALEFEPPDCVIPPPFPDPTYTPDFGYFFSRKETARPLTIRLTCQNDLGLQ